MPQDNSYMQYLVHTEAFLNERMRGLEHFLRVVTAHEHIVRDLDLKSFLTSADFKSREIPYSNKLMNFMSSLPSLSQIAIDKDTFHAYRLMLSNGAKVD